MDNPDQPEPSLSGIINKPNNKFLSGSLVRKLLLNIIIVLFILFYYLKVMKRVLRVWKALQVKDQKDPMLLLLSLQSAKKIRSNLKLDKYSTMHNLTLPKISLR